MRRKIELYIDGALADIDDQGLVLFNYSLTDLAKPTVVKNSYSKQVTLPGTPANDAIFSDAFRVDRTNGSGFNAMQRTPFTIYNDQGEIVESGYLKLDKVNRTREQHSYNVTLYGGLGSFFYALSYRSDGEKKTLADLNYIGGGADELDFNITAALVQSWWEDARNGGSIAKAKVLNFAACYEGIPDGDFDAKKAVADPTDIGLPSPVTEDGTTYRPYGATTVNLANAIDEWAAKDLRCYLQRPVLNVGKLLEAIAKSADNGGFTVDYESGVTVPMSNKWITLPLLTSLKGISQVENTYNLSLTPISTPTSPDAARLTLPAGAVVGPFAKEHMEASFEVTFDNPNGSSWTNWTLDLFELDTPITGYIREQRAVFFAQVIAFSAEGAVVGGSPVYSHYIRSYNPDEYDETPEDVATLCGFTPDYAADFAEQDSIALLWWSGESTGSLLFDAAVDCMGAASFLVRMHCYILESQFPSSGGTPYVLATYGGDSRIWWVRYISANNYDYGPSLTRSISFQIGENTVVVKTPSQARSGALIKKADVLNTSHTPAEYLLSLAKIFGWYFIADRTQKKITVRTRNGFFTTGLDVIDLTDRVDRSQALEVTAIRAASKWYDLRYKDGAGAFWTDYKDRYGVTYGIQRIDTGYDFDSTPEDLLDSCILRAAVESLDYSRYWNIITDGGVVVPSVFVDSGHTYTLWDSDGKTKDFSVSRPSAAAAVTYYNAVNEGYDKRGASKLQFKAADGKAVDGSDVLVVLDTFWDYQGIKLSDDSAFMVLLNDGKPCWDFSPASGALYIPCFRRFSYDGLTILASSLEFGDVRELAIPGVTAADDMSLYARKHRAYLRDLLDEDTKVLKCKVNLEGLDVGPDLLRRFFWYEGSLWVLNAITNYSLTTWDPAECEFVQVQDMDNYTNGQTN